MYNKRLDNPVTN